MTTYDILAQGVAVLATLCNVISFQMKDSGKLLLTQGVIGSILWATHFAMLNAWAGCLINVVALVRAVVIHRRYRNGGSRRTLVFLCLLLAAAGTVGAVIDWDGGFSGWAPLWLIRVVLVLLAAVMVGQTVVLWTGRVKPIRVLQLCAVSPLWLCNNLFAGSIFGVITEIANAVSAAVSLYRFREKKPL